jgi:Zn-dependent protease
LNTLTTILLVAPVLLFSVIAHEIAHGYVALRQGDRTALDAGRLSWNPARHIDLYMTIILPVIMLTGSTLIGGRGIVLGGAKPVPVNPANYRNLRLGDILVSLAGVATNLLIALCCTALVALCGIIGSSAEALQPSLAILQAMFAYGVWINAGLIAFNLLPIPPLDGSHVFKYLLPRRIAIQYVRFSRYGLLLLIALLYFGGGLLQAWVTPAMLSAQFALGTVSGFSLPSAAQWLR